MIIYARRNPFVWVRFFITDLLCSLISLFFSKKLIRSFNRILIANPSHLGDLVISSYIADALKGAFPNLQIDFLCGSWGRDLVGASSNINNVFEIDLPSMDRGNRSILKKYALFIASVKKSFSLLREQNYDCVFSVYSYSPSYIPLLWALRTSPIVGYISAGYGPLLSLAYSPYKTKQSCHELEYQLQVFESFMPIPNISSIKSSMKDGIRKLPIGLELPTNVVACQMSSTLKNDEYGFLKCSDIFQCGKHLNDLCNCY